MSLSELAQTAKSFTIVHNAFSLTLLLGGATFLYTAISRKVVGKNVHATIPKGIVGDFGFTLLQRHRQEWHERPWM